MFHKSSIKIHEGGAGYSSLTYTQLTYTLRGMRNVIRRTSYASLGKEKKKRVCVISKGAAPRQRFQIITTFSRPTSRLKTFKGLILCTLARFSTP